MPWRRSGRAPSRRLGLVLLIVGSALLAIGETVVARGPTEAFSNPPIVESRGGVLSATLTVARAVVTVGGHTVTTTVYNGLYMPPVLKVKPGETIRLRLINATTSPAATNVHYHGLGVSPQGNGDNVFIEVDPGAAPFDYDIPIPLDHPQGLFWYHPHVHPGVNPAIAAGLSGGLIIGDILAPFPELQGITERILLLKDLKLDKSGQPVIDPDPSGPTIRTINGLFQPQIDIAPNELQFWRIGNIGANIYYKLRFDGHVPFYIIGIDGNLQNRLSETRELLIPPGARYEVLVRGPRAGRYKLHAEPFDTGPAGDQYPGQLLATLLSRGDPVYPGTPLPTMFPSVPDLSGLAPDTTRTIVFNDTPDPNVFVIDNRVYAHDRIDQTVSLGALEEWIVQNASQELHVFHIHQTDFQVTEVNGVRQPFTGYQDTVSVPVATANGPGEVKIRIPFTNPLIVGEFVYHCHIVQHADLGMMANILVVGPARTSPRRLQHRAEGLERQRPVVRREVRAEEQHGEAGAGFVPARQSPPRLRRGAVDDQLLE